MQENAYTGLTAAEAAGLSLGAGGNFYVLDTNWHYGMFHSIVIIEDAVFDGFVEMKQLGNGIAFVSGSVEPQRGAILVGATSGAMATIMSVTVTSGAFADGDAAGYMVIAPMGTTPFSASEVVKIALPGGRIVESDALTTATAANGGSNAPAAGPGTTTHVAGTVLNGVILGFKLASGVVRPSLI